MSFFFIDDKNNQNIETLKVLMGLVSENKLGRLEIKEGDLKISIDGRPLPPHRCGDIPPMPPQEFSKVEPTNGVSNTVQPVIENKSTNVEKKSNNEKIVKAPIVGTFYASPSPDKPPYVKVGDSVKKGDIIMIIESMKLMNEVQSDFDGVVKEVLVKDGSPVEYDQPIMIIE